MTQGGWAYDIDSLLNITHLRFFILSSIVSLFEAAEKRMEKMIGRIIDAGRSELVFGRTWLALAGLGSDENRFQEQSCIYNMSFTLSRIPPEAAIGLGTSRPVSRTRPVELLAGPVDRRGRGSVSARP